MPRTSATSKRKKSCWSNSIPLLACVLATLLGAVSASPIPHLSSNDSLFPRGGLGVDVGQPDLASRSDVLIDGDAVLYPRIIPEDKSTPGPKQLANEALTVSGGGCAASSGGKKEISQEPDSKKPNADHDGLPVGRTLVMNNFAGMADIHGHPTRVQTDRFRQVPTVRDGTDTFNFKNSDSSGSYHFGSPRYTRARASYYPRYGRFPQDTVIVGVDHRGGIVNTNFFPVTDSSRTIHGQNSPTGPSQTPGADGAPASGSQGPNTSGSHSAGSAGSNVPSSPSGGSGGQYIPAVKKGKTSNFTFNGKNGVRIGEIEEVATVNNNF